MNISANSYISVPSVIDCGPPPIPQKSMVEAPVTTLGNTAVYTCNSGYELSTGTLTVTRQCMDNSEWSGVTPSCIGKICIENTTFHGSIIYDVINLYS